MVCCASKTIRLMPSSAIFHTEPPGTNGMQSFHLSICGISTGGLSRSMASTSCSGRDCSRPNWWWAIHRGGDTTSFGRKPSLLVFSTPIGCRLEHMRTFVCSTRVCRHTIPKWQRGWGKSVPPFPSGIASRPPIMAIIALSTTTATYVIPQAFCVLQKTCSIQPSIRHKSLLVL